jgi:nicotinate-nucleotide adenylyltransferase
MNTCVFGGTFDPLHLGHLIIAGAVRDQFEIDRFLFMPAYIPPHKEQGSCSAVADRLAMLELALKGKPGYEISTIEIERGGTSYTVDTLQQLRQSENISLEELFLLIGMDSLVDFNNWRQPGKILELAQVIVAPRPHYTVEQVDPAWRTRVQFLQSPLIYYSSSQIRERCRTGQNIRFMVSPEIYLYIKEKGLYRNS